MQWNQVATAIKDFFNQPVPIICCTVGALCVFILTIIAKTSIGKRGLKKLNTKMIALESVIKQFLADLRAEKTKAEQEYQKYIAELEKARLEEQHKREKLEELVLFIAENTHNSKIKEYVKTYNKESNEDGREETKDTNGTTQTL